MLAFMCNIFVKHARSTLILILGYKMETNKNAQMATRSPNIIINITSAFIDILFKLIIVIQIGFLNRKVSSWTLRTMTSKILYNFSTLLR